MEFLTNSMFQMILEFISIKLNQKKKKLLIVKKTHESIFNKLKKIYKTSLIKFSFFTLTNSIKFPFNFEIKKQFKANNHKLALQDFSSCCLPKNIFKETS
jgi:hypothetical protein